MTGTQSFVATAPLNLIYVADYRKLDANLPAETKVLFAGTTVGAVAQNVYLFCAAHGLNTGIRADIDTAPLEKILGLGDGQKVLLAQSVGYP
jgi:nitroreductase